VCVAKLAIPRAFTSHVGLLKAKMNIEKPKNKTLDELVSRIKKIFTDARDRVTRNVNLDMIYTYWEIGKEIIDNEQDGNLRAEYGKNLLITLSKRLTRDLGKGFSRSNLQNMRNFYVAYPNRQTLSGNLSWSHYCELLKISDIDKRAFYEKESTNSNWAVRTLQRQIESSLFERLILSQGKQNKQIVRKLAAEGQVIQKPHDMMKEPHVLEFLGIPENKPILERDLEQRLLHHLEDFLLELGKGFMFVGSQYRITLNNVHHYVDMVFYNKILRAYVLIDLKINSLRGLDVGQMNMYLNYFKTEVNDEYDNPPIGIILCGDKNDIVAEYALGGLTNQIFASKYVYYLPDNQLLIKQIEDVLKGEV
jgi:predicted nuclease of restriction endonuclease-like (RecB) superfamily